MSDLFLKLSRLMENGAIFWFGIKLGVAKEGEDNIEVDEDEDDTEDGADNIEVEEDEDDTKDGGDNIEVEEEDEDDTGEGGDAVEVIVSFDITKEVFMLMSRPDLGYNEDEKLTVYQDKLAILCDIWDVDDGECDLIDLWVMEEGTCASGEKWSWT